MSWRTSEIQRMKPLLKASKIPREAFAVLQRHGYEKIGAGDWKIAFRKRDLVVKVFCKDEEMETEKFFGMEDSLEGIDAWADMVAHAKKSGNGRHILPYLDVIQPGIVFQAAVPSSDKCNKFSCKVVALKLGIRDWNHNHGHIKNSPVFFDGQLGFY